MSSWEEENCPQVRWFQEKENIRYALSIGQAGLPVLSRYSHLYAQFLSCPQVYLERVPGSSTGCIKWHIDFGCCGLLVDEVTLRLSCVEEYGGEITVTMTGIPGQKRVRYAVGTKIKTDNSIRVLQRKGLWHCWWFHFVYNATHASLFVMRIGKLLVDEKITALYQTNMFPEHYIKRYKQQKRPLKLG